MQPRRLAAVAAPQGCASANTGACLCGLPTCAKGASGGQRSGPTRDGGFHGRPPGGRSGAVSTASRLLPHYCVKLLQSRGCLPYFVKHHTSCLRWLHFTTRNQRSVLVGDSNTRVLSSCNCSMLPGSKKRRPAPKRTGTMPMWISSTSPARKHC